MTTPHREATLTLLETLRRPLSCLLLGALSCAEPGAGGSPPSSAPTETTSSASVRIMTYNVNFGLAGDAETLAAVREVDADVVFLQETTETWERSLRAELDDRYPHALFRHCCGAGGLGVLSRFPLLAREYLAPPDGGWFPAWRVLVETPIGQLQTLHVHLRPQLSESGSFLGGVFSTPPIRRAEIAAYHAALDPAAPTLVVGDFNENGRGGAIRFLEDRGMRSALPGARGAEPTWRWQTSIGTIREQLDHIVHDARLEVVHVEVVERGRSDHLPVVATIRRAR